MSQVPPFNMTLEIENRDLRDRLAEAERTLHAIHGGEADAVLVEGTEGARILTLTDADHSYRLLIEDMNEGALSLTDEGLVLYCNRRLAEILRTPRERVVGSFIGDRVAPDFQSRFRALLAHGDPNRHFEELVMLAGDGTQVPVYLSLKRMSRADLPSYVFLLVTDLTEINEQKRLQAQLNLEASVFTHAREGILITDPDSRIIDVNEAFSRITGYSRDEALGQKANILKSDHHPPEFFAAMWRDLLSEGHWYGEVWSRRKNGEVFAEMLNISTLRDAQGKVLRYIAMMSDITMIKVHEQQLEHLAHYDALTNLPNRVLLADRLQHAMAQTHRSARGLAVAYIDLDKFKEINDTFGHDTGDKLLMVVADRMQEAIREGDTLCRLGGDEFVAVLRDIDDFSACEPTLKRLLASAAGPVKIAGRLHQISASIGVTFYPQPQEIGADQLMRQADQAMYLAKQSGKNRYHLFDAAQDRSVREHYETVSRIRLAMARQEFVLRYQPKVNMRTGAIVGAEALIRWQHPERGLLLPASFLPLIEDHPIIVELGEWVIQTALNQIASWRTEGLAMRVSVNVGSRQLQRPDFVLRVRSLLAAYPQLEPGSLMFEVLETSALEDLGRVSHAIDECQKLGLWFAMDDFGTGYSSLTYLKRLPVNELKIDRSFVHNMLNDTDDLSILNGVIGLAHAFDRQVTAEGVETVAQGRLLLEIGCELAQGFAVAHPMPAQEMPDWCQRWHPDPAWLGVVPMHPEDLPLVFASVEQRALARAISECLHNGGAMPAVSTHSDGALEKWLLSQAHSELFGSDDLKALDAGYRRVLDCATTLHQLHHQGQEQEALALLPQFTRLSDAMLGDLNALAVAAARKPGLALTA